MLLFSTVLPIKENLDQDEFIRFVIAWNQGNPHEENRIPNLVWNGERNTRFGTDNLWMQIEEYRNKNIIAVRFEKIDENGVAWDTDYVMNFNEKKMSVRLDRSYLEDALVRDGAFSTPAFIQLLIKHGYVEDDGNLPIDWEPIYISADNLQLAADVINGVAKYSLPIVYISCPNSGKSAVDYCEIAKKLKGIAHVLVQQDTQSCSMLRIMTNNKSEYDGAIGVYFSNQTDWHKKFLRHDYPGSDEKMAAKVEQCVLQYSTSQRIDMLYTWPGVNNALLRDRYSSKRAELSAAQTEIQTANTIVRRKMLAAEQEAMSRVAAANQEAQSRVEAAEQKARKRVEAAEQETENMRLIAESEKQNAIEVGELLDSVDDEIERMRRTISDLARQNEILTNENQGLRGRIANMGDKPVLYLGEEEDVYADEIKDLILLALDNELKNTQGNSRRADVLGDLIRSNGGLQNHAKKRAEKLKGALHGYTRMTSTLKSDLEALGFVVTKGDGGHFKLRYNNDGRYLAVLAATASDHRAGDNTASDIVRKMF